MDKIRNRFLIVFSFYIFLIAFNFIPLGIIFPSLKENKFFLNIEKGCSKNKLVNKLITSGGVIDSGYIRILLFFNKKKIQNGRYLYDPLLSLSQNVKKIFNGIDSGKTIRITFIEGVNSKNIALKFQSLEFFSARSFKNAEKIILNDEKLCKKYKIKRNVSDLEGYLFPDTYEFKKGESPQQVIIKFLNRFIGIVNSIDENISPENLYDKLTIASLIQKETGYGEEALIASVIYNRLKIRMRLQIDATILYAMQRDGIITNNITKKNKYYDSPYNTYCHYGIPPTAICNPGEKSIIAAFLPQPTKYLYYVSKNNGWHTFSQTYKEHQLKVYKYQKRRR